MENTNLKKNFIWNTIGSFTTAITSLFYTLILTRLSDLNTTGLYTIAFAIACTFVTLASFGGRTYQVTDTNNEIPPFSYIFSRYLTVGTTILLLGVYLFIKGYNTFEYGIILIICLFKFLEELSDVYFGILQKADCLYKVGMFQFIKAIVNVILFAIIIYCFNNLFLSFLILFLLNTLFLIFVERKSAKKRKKWKFEIDKIGIIKYFKANLFICLLTFLTTYIVNMPKYSIDSLLNNELQAIFGMIVMPATVMLLFGGFILNPFLVSIAEKYNKNQISNLINLFIKMFFLIFGIGIIILIVCYFIGIPLLNLIYGVNLNDYKLSLLIIIAGSIFYAITAGISSSLIAMRVIKSQLLGNIIVILLSLVLCNYLVGKYEVLGASITYSLVIFLRFLIYLIIMVIVLSKKTKQFNGKGE